MRSRRGRRGSLPVSAFGSLGRLTEKRRMKTTREVLLEWRDLAAERTLLARKHFSAVAISLRRLMSLAVTEWSSCMLRRKQLLFSMDSQMCRRDRKRTERALASWLAACLQLRRRRNCVLLRQDNQHKRLLLRVFTVLRNCSDTSSLLALRARALSARLLESLELWRDFVDLRRRFKMLCYRNRRALFFEYSRLSLDQWLFKIHHVKRLRHGISKLLLRQHVAIMRSVFEGWEGAWRRRELLLSQLSRISSRSQSFLLSSSLHAWRSFKVFVVRSRSAYMRCDIRLSTFKARVFAELRAFAKSEWARKHALVRLCSREHRRCIVNSISTWRRVSQIACVQRQSFPQEFISQE